MSMGQREGRQNSLFIAACELRSPGHRFYEGLESLLVAAGFDRFAEDLCRRFYTNKTKRGRPSVPPGVYFRMLLIGYFEGIESERGICWRCADSLSLKSFLGYQVHEATPDHSTLSRIRTRLEPDVYDEVFRWVLEVLDVSGLLEGKTVGVDSTYLRADASMKTIVRRDTDESYRQYLRRLAQESGMEEPTDEDLRRMDKKRSGKKVSNDEWRSPTDPDARIMRLKDGRTRLSYKAEHVVDMESGAICSAEVLPATEGDTASLEGSLRTADANLQDAKGLDAHDDDDDDDDDGPAANTAGWDSQIGPSDSVGHIKEVVGDKGYHKAELVRVLKEQGIRTYIPEPSIKGRRHWQDKGGDKTAHAVYQNRQRTKRAKGRRLQRRRGELIERTFAHICETGGHRRVRLRGMDNVKKRYLLQVAAYNLSLLLRLTLSVGTPRELFNASKKMRLGAGLRCCTLPVLFSAATILVFVRLLAQFSDLSRRWFTRPRRTPLLWSSCFARSRL